METLPITNRVKILTASAKRKFHFRSAQPDSEHNTASYWNGGSRYNYSIFNFRTGARKPAPCGEFPSFIAKTKLAAGEILIETGLFNGKPSTPAIHCRMDEETEVKKYLGV